MESKSVSNPLSTLSRPNKSVSASTDPRLNENKDKENDQVVFLKQLVSRLNAELARCRNLGKISSDPTTLSELLSSGDALWLWDASTLSPLLHGQDEYIAELQNKITEYEKHIPALRSQCQLLVAENERLHKHIEQPQQVDSEMPHSTEITSRFLSQQNQQLRKALHQLRMELDKKTTSLSTLEDTVQNLEKILAQRNSHMKELEQQLETTLVSSHRLEKHQKDLEQQYQHHTHLKGYWETRAKQYETYLSDLIHQHHQLILDFQEVVATTSTHSASSSLMTTKTVQGLIEVFESHVHDFLNLRQSNEKLVDQLEVKSLGHQDLVLQLEDVQKRYQATQTSLSTIMDNSISRHEWNQYKAQCESLLEGYKLHQTVLVENEAKQKYQMERAMREKRMVETTLNKFLEEMKLDKERMTMELSAIHKKMKNETKQHNESKTCHEM
ncbi:hypothetical protein HMI56_003115 [Coelomomyces lativittatus]|nr:hypothetical protein HMI56_003115 [Coelomomyces lativittatus]